MTPSPLTDLLHTPGAGYTLVVAPAGGAEPVAFSRRGVADLLDLLENNPAMLRGALIADKVVGRAAAALMILGGVARLHTDVISTHALDLFDGSGVDVSYDTVTDHVINRAGDGWCPLEIRCRDLATPGECLDAIRSFLSSLTDK